MEAALAPHGRTQHLVGLPRGPGLLFPVFKRIFMYICAQRMFIRRMKLQGPCFGSAGKTRTLLWKGENAGDPWTRPEHAGVLCTHCTGPLGVSEMD